MQATTQAQTERHATNTGEQPVAIVTGASSGIGLGVTQALLERGWRVMATSRTICKSKDLKASSDLVLVDGEVSKKETAVNVVVTALKHFGRIDLLVKLTMPVSLFQRRSPTTPRKTTIW